MIRAYRPTPSRDTLRDILAVLAANPSGAVMLLPFALVGFALRYL